MKHIFSLITILFALSPLAAQTVIFDEEILIDNYESEVFVMPPSPLTTQVIFVGGHDIVQTTKTYGNPAGRAIAKEWHDFIGFTPDSSGASLGWVSVNHEMIYQNDRIGDGGGMTVFQVAENNGELEVMEQTLSDGRQGQYFNVDFVNTVGETGMNCAGISAPNGRIWTAEEWFRSSTSSITNGNTSSSTLPITVAGIRDCYGVRDTADFTINTPEFPLVDGTTIRKYENFNYMVEIDPKEARAIRKQYNWGRAGWEGGAITADGKYAYLGVDGSPAPFVRVTATTPWDFTDVTIEVYKQDNNVGERWIEMDMTNTDNIFGGLVDAAWAAGATMFMRNEWVAIDQETGMVYWTETGRDGSSGAGARFVNEANDYPVLPAAHHNEVAAENFGLDSAMDENYQDYYGRVLYYDPATEEVGVVVNGGPYFAASPSETDYPDKHLSNPDGLNIINIDGKQFLMIQEDLNGSSFGRMPEGISNRMCELYLLSVNARNADVNDLVRVTAIPRGAEITGAIQISDNTILVNSQHPNANNPFPFNHSVTMAIHGWANVTTNLIEIPGENELKDLKVFPNPATREVYISEATDFAIYNMQGQRMKVYRNSNHADVSDLPSGSYFILTSNNQSYKLIVE
jgi:secreted PhoX family phosphatase